MREHLVNNHELPSEGRLFLLQTTQAQPKVVQCDYGGDYNEYPKELR